MSSFQSLFLLSDSWPSKLGMSSSKFVIDLTLANMPFRNTSMSVVYEVKIPSTVADFFNFMNHLRKLVFLKRMLILKSKTEWNNNQTAFENNTTYKSNFYQLQFSLMYNKYFWNPSHEN